ncbi:PTS sugar transporter [Leuconostoc palmae]|uniref:PTS sugar transporter n=1 Tax=Leuconostoc palmae TaxID=501487 RepID=UPI001FE8C397|nr:PTS sugar transporter [Leuconostoc palmae]
MNKNVKLGFENEIKFQKRMIKNLQKWQSVLSSFTGIGIIIAYLFRKQHFALFISGMSITMIGVLLILVIGYAIIMGKRI